MYISWVTIYYVDINQEKHIYKIIIRYLKFNFWIDLFGTVPFFEFESKCLLFLKLIRLLRFRTYIYNIWGFIEYWLSEYMHSRKELLLSIQKTIRFLILLFFTMHFISWVWIWIGKGEKSWASNKASLLGDITNPMNLYIAAIYYVMTTFATVGYGDFTGNTNLEYMFTMVIEFLGIGFFGYVIGNISTMIELFQITYLSLICIERFMKRIAWIES